MIFALAGNQNCGKTTLFNALTGSNQHVGNFPGVTVDQKMGEIKNAKNAFVVDLPGIYSLRTYTNEEIVSRDFILNNKPDGIINIIDATNIERNLYLTLQLLELKIPMVLALNMMDEVKANDGNINIEKLSSSLGIPVIPITASKGEGVQELVDQAINVAKHKIKPTVYDFCADGSPVHRAIHGIIHLIEDHAENAEISTRFCVTKLIEGNNKELEEKLELDQNEKELIEHIVLQMEEESGLDRNAAIAEMRYDFIETVVKKSVVKAKESKEHKRSEKIDRILTGKWTAIPIFLGIMFLIFFLTFNVFGKLGQDLINLGVVSLSDLVNNALINFGTNDIVRSLVIEGIFGGIGAILSFLPIIIVLFFFLSILEDTGYMARVAFVMDKLLRKLGLSGKSFVPLLIGFGCSVPAILSTRTLSSERDRKMTILLVPYMSCSAKIPVYAIFCSAFFPKYAALVMIGLYVFGIIIGILMALLFKSTLFKGKPIPFVMELPNYRLPSAKTTFMLLWDKAKDFLSRAFTVIFLATIVIWFLRSFDIRINHVSDSSQSMLASIGSFIAPIFKPLGFGTWQATTSLITGLTAKEAVISTMGILLNSGDAGLVSSLSTLFPTTLAAISFLIFTLLYTPCIAAISCIKKELHSTTKTIGVVILQCLVAWVVSFLVFNIGGLFI